MGPACVLCGCLWMKLVLDDNGGLINPDRGSYSLKLSRRTLEQLYVQFSVSLERFKASS